MLIGTMVTSGTGVVVALIAKRDAKRGREASESALASLSTPNGGSHVYDSLARLEQGTAAIREDVVQMRIGQAVLGEQITRNAGDIDRLRGNIARIHERLDTTE